MLLALIIMCSFCLIWIYNLTLNILYQIPISLILVTTIVFLIVVIWHKIGFVKNDLGIYFCYFLCGYAIFKTKIDFAKFTDICILQSRKKMAYQKMNKMEPNMIYYDHFHNIYLLNNLHTEKSKLISTTDREKAEKMVDFFLINTHLKSNVYQPRFKKNQ